MIGKAEYVCIIGNVDGQVLRAANNILNDASNSSVVTKEAPKPACGTRAPGPPKAQTAETTREEKHT